MKNFFPFLIIRFVSAFLILSMVCACKPNEPYVYVCRDGLIDYQKTDKLRYFQSIINPKDSLVTLVIRTDDDYKKNIADRLEKIDFSNKTLLAGRIRAGMPGYVAKQSVKSYCTAKEIYFDVEYVVNIAGETVISEIPFYAIIPKISEETKVRFIIHRQ